MASSSRYQDSFCVCSFFLHSNIDCDAMMAYSWLCHKNRPQWDSGNKVARWKSECILEAIQNACACVASCRPYVTDPSQRGCWGKRRCPPGPFKVISAQRGGWRKMEGEYLGISLYQLSKWCSFLFVSVCYSPPIFSLPPSPCLLSWQSVCMCVCGSRESAPGSWCDEVMRRDVVIQQFQPKGHICSLSFALYISLHLSRWLFMLCVSLSLCLSIEYVLCSLCPSTSEHIYHLYCISTHQRRLFWTVGFCYDSWRGGVVGLTAGWRTVRRRPGVDGECHPIALQLKAQALTGWYLRAYW